MFRFSITSILLLSILAALNFAVLRIWPYFTDVANPIVLLAGLMPLFDGFVISTYASVTKKYRFTLRRLEKRDGFARIFAITTAFMLAVTTLMCLSMSPLLIDLIDRKYGVFMALHVWLGLQENPETVVGIELCIMMSGPLLIIAAVFSFIASRYKLVITRREP